MNSMKEVLLDSGIVTEQDVAAADARAKEREAAARELRRQREENQRVVDVIMHAMTATMRGEMLYVLERFPELLPDALMRAWVAELGAMQGEDQRQRMAALWAKFLHDHNLVSVPA